MLLDIAESSKTHWRYNIVVVRCLRTLIRKDESISAPHFKFFVEKTCDDHPSIVRFCSVDNRYVILMTALRLAIRKFSCGLLRNLYSSFVVFSTSYYENIEIHQIAHHGREPCRSYTGTKSKPSEKIARDRQPYPRVHLQTPGRSESAC